MPPKPRVYITAPIMETGISPLRSRAGIEVYSGPLPMPRQMLLDKASKADALLCILSDQIDQAFFDACPNLGIVSQHAVGYNNIDLAAASRAGVWITNTPGVLTEATADVAWALILAISRRVVEADSVMRSGGYTTWEPQFMLGADIYGKTLGILGAGRIGSAVARRSVGWRMKVLYHSRSQNPEMEKELQATRVDFSRLLQESDFLSVHLPLTKDTHHLIGAEEIARMKSTAFLINTARGPIIDEAALVTALQEIRIAGAGLDVYENEPKMMPGLKELENAILLPHIGSSTIHTREEMARVAGENILCYLQGKRPLSIVNPEVLPPAIASS